MNIERNNFDYLRAYAESQSSVTSIVQELIDAYALISQNLGISGFQFIQTLKSKGTAQQQTIYLAAQLNSVRPKNALLGIASNQEPPEFVSREIAP
ncbi:Uncharacterised protein [uncultured archaeon]|nr:Uncharacterised protein [uncultured archaeon]